MICEGFDDDRSAGSREDILGGEVRQGERREELQHPGNKQSYRKNEGRFRFIYICYKYKIIFLFVDIHLKSFYLKQFVIIVPSRFLSIKQRQ